MTPRVGFWGKVPARGDFIASGLSRGFTTAWDGWIAQAIADARATLGAAWEPAWMVAPVWRYAAAPGLLGDQAVAGVWMPSVDRAGRGFPLTFAAECDPGDATADWLGSTWLDAAEELGRAALEQGLGPQDLAARLPAASADGTRLPDTAGGSVWWTDGSPRVPAQTSPCATLPGAVRFARMIDDTLP